LAPLATGHDGSVVSLASSPDGRTLATASWDHTARLWDITDRRPAAPGRDRHPHRARRHRALGGVQPDGHTLATAGDDRTARLWETNVDRVAAHVCGVAFPAITRGEWQQYLPGLAYRPPCR